MSTNGKLDDLNDIRLEVTEDPILQKEQVLRAAAIDTRKRQLGGRVALIATKIGKSIERMQRREKWEAHLTVLALDHLVLGFCETIYMRGLQLEAEALAAEEKTGANNKE